MAASPAPTPPDREMEDLQQRLAASAKKRRDAGAHIKAVAAAAIASTPASGTFARPPAAEESDLDDSGALRFDYEQARRDRHAACARLKKTAHSVATEPKTRMFERELAENATRDAVDEEPSPTSPPADVPGRAD